MGGGWWAVGSGHWFGKTSVQPHKAVKKRAVLWKPASFLNTMGTNCRVSKLCILCVILTLVSVATIVTLWTIALTGGDVAGPWMR